MHDGKSRTPRHWTVIAEELAHEADAGRVLELSRELNEALHAQGANSPAPPQKPQADHHVPATPDPKSGTR
ncbi:MAG TPA: hypothetical protein VMD76_05430 [Candidatus Sulfotelmatobacter sp.]|nr:hypothetical protein [Candidatus Sulfotelmatobacter sp.]